MPKPQLVRLLAALLVIAMFAGACGSDSSEVARDEASAEDRTLQESDAEDDFVSVPVDAPAEEEAMEEEASVDLEQSMAEESDDGGIFDAEAPSSPTASDSDDSADKGLFSEQEESEEAVDREDDNFFANNGQRVFIEADEDPFSTFALDVDTGSYTVGRRWLEEGVLPPVDSVRPEEYINAFDYDYDVPRRGLDVTIDGGPSPFDNDNYLVRIGVQAEIVDAADRPPVALTFVIDTSGSMDRDDRLGLVKESLEILVEELEDDDTVAIVIYSDDAGVVLDPTPISDRDLILDAIDDLRPGGSTNLESGLRTGYRLAREAFRDDGINRVILASDGVANVGTTDPDALARQIRDDADAGIQLVTVGYGMGNFSDVTMEQLADQGDGFYAYIDTEDEAERLFKDNLISTLITAAIDAKIQVEFDPDIVDEYRLIGFENRGVRDSDFRNDNVDAGELGAGHQVTAIYELDLHRGVDIDDRDDIGEVFLRWEDPVTGEVIEIDQDIELRDIEGSWIDVDDSLQIATVVAAYAEILRNSPHADRLDLTDVADEAEQLADRLRRADLDELVELIQRAAELS